MRVDSLSRHQQFHSIFKLTLNKMPIQASKIFLKIFFAALLTFLVACNESNNAISKKIEKTQKVEKIIPEKELIPEEKETILNVETNSDVKPITDAPQTELTEIEQQLNALKKKLNTDNQSNAALRQHMNFLIEKVKENQRIIKQQSQEITPKAE